MRLTDANLNEPDSNAREFEAWDYRRQGFTYREIGKRMGLHPCAARECVAKAARLIAVDDATQVEEARHIELERLDDLLRPCMKIINDDDSDATTMLRAIDRLLAIEGRRAKLLGYDKGPPPMPDTTPTDLAQLIREIRERCAELNPQEKGPSPNCERLVSDDTLGSADRIGQRRTSKRPVRNAKSALARRNRTASREACRQPSLV